MTKKIRSGHVGGDPCDQTETFDLPDTNIQRAADPHERIFEEGMTIR